MRELIMRIVATGIGVVSSAGAGVADFEEAVFEGRSGIRPNKNLEESFPDGFAAEIIEFAPQEWLGNKGLRLLDRGARLICVAAQMALRAAGLVQADESESDPELGLVLGTMFGSVHSIASFDWAALNDGPNLVNPMGFTNTVINGPAGQAALKHRLRGANSTISAGLVSGLYAIHCASEFLRFGRAKALLAGGMEELCEESYSSFVKAGLLSHRGCMLPFAPDRDGTVLGEGAAVWMLETAEGALRRGAKPLVEICGFGSAFDAHDLNNYSIRGDGALTAIRQAQESAGIGPESVQCIVASANGSPSGDSMEIHALRKVFGKRLPSIPVCAPKRVFGECLGASGALLSITAGIALQRRLLPPTPGFEEAEDGLLLSASPQQFEGDYALVNCFGCDGNNTALILKRWSENP